jgi:hypothetical protein
MNQSSRTDIELLEIANSYAIPLISPTQRFNLQRKIRTQEKKTIANEILMETVKETVKETLLERLSENSTIEKPLRKFLESLNSGNLNMILIQKF